jgi:DNA-binding MarR family transcriptional regulator
MADHVPGSASAPERLPIDSPGKAVARLSIHLARALEPLGVSVPQYLTLSLLAEGSLGSEAMSERQVDAPTIVSPDGLVARGLVDRSSDPAGGGRLKLELTDAGREQLIAADAAVAEKLDTVAGFSPLDEPHTLVTSLARWHGALNGFRDVVELDFSAPGVPSDQS